MLPISSQEPGQQNIFEPASFQRHVALGQGFLRLDRTSEGDDVAGRTGEMQQSHVTGFLPVTGKK